MVKLFLDCDGVLADFDKRAFEIFGMGGKEYEDAHGSSSFWRGIRKYAHPVCGRDFFRTLELMLDARELFDAVKHLSPTILTGYAAGSPWAVESKKEWAAEHFPNTPVITCLSKDKRDHMANVGDILIDDTEKHRQKWEDAGGVWISHTSAQSSIAQLRALKPEWFSVAAQQ